MISEEIMSLATTLESKARGVATLEDESAATVAELNDERTKRTAAESAASRIAAEYEAYKAAHPDGGPVDPPPPPPPVVDYTIKNIRTSSDANGQRIDFETNGAVLSYGHDNWISPAQLPSRRSFDLTYLAAQTDVPCFVNWPDGKSTKFTVKTGGTVVTPPPVEPPPVGTGKLADAWYGYSDRGSSGLLDFEKRTAKLKGIVLMHDIRSAAASNASMWSGFAPDINNRAPYGPPWTPSIIGDRKIVLQWGLSWSEYPRASWPGQNLQEALTDATHLQAIKVAVMYMREAGVKPKSVIIRLGHEMDQDFYPWARVNHAGKNTPQAYNAQFIRLADAWLLEAPDLIDSFELCGSAFPQGYQNAERNAWRSAAFKGLEKYCKYVGFDMYIDRADGFEAWKADMDWWMTLCKQWGARFCVSEFGIGTTGPDDVAQAKKFLDYFLANNIHHLGYFDSAQGSSDHHLRGKIMDLFLSYLKPVVNPNPPEPTSGQAKFRMTVNPGDNGPNGGNFVKWLETELMGGRRLNGVTVNTGYGAQNPGDISGGSSVTYGANIYGTRDIMVANFANWKNMAPFDPAAYKANPSGYWNQFGSLVKQMHASGKDDFWANQGWEFDMDPGQVNDLDNWIKAWNFNIAQLRLAQETIYGVSKLKACINFVQFQDSYLKTADSRKRVLDKLVGLNGAGLDFYDKTQAFYPYTADGKTWADPPKVWNETVQPDLDFWASECKARGLAFTVPEVGLWYGPTSTDTRRGGKDNEYFIRRTFAEMEKMAALGLLKEGFWSWFLHDPDVPHDFLSRSDLFPKSRLAFKELAS